MKHPWRLLFYMCIRRCIYFQFYPAERIIFCVILDILLCYVNACCNQMEWEHGDREIGAITCASKVENVDEIANVVVRKVRAHLDEEEKSD